jgi:hypothetical protein
LIKEAVFVQAVLPLRRRVTESNLRWRGKVRKRAVSIGPRVPTSASTARRTILKPITCLPQAGTQRGCDRSFPRGQDGSRSVHPIAALLSTEWIKSSPRPVVTSRPLVLLAQHHPMPVVPFHSL